MERPVIRYVTFGIILDDIVFPHGETRMAVLGGGGPQTAWGMAAARGGGESVGLVAGVGEDMETGALAPMQAARVNLDGVRTTAHPTPRAWQLLEQDGRRTQVWRVPERTLGVQLARAWEVLPPHYQEARAFHWGIHPGEDGSLDFAQSLRARGKFVSLEPFRPPDHPLNDTALADILSACDLFSPNWHEAQAITGHTDRRAILEHLLRLGARFVAIRHGADGAEVWDLGTRRGVWVPAVPVRVVDTVGAGNAFCGALLARLDDGLDVGACHASAAASYMIEQVGLPPTLPDPADYAHRLDGVRAGMSILDLDEIVFTP